MRLRFRHRELRICAVIAVRDDLDYLVHLLPGLAAQRIDVVIVDNDSTDGTREFLESCTPPVLSVVRQPWAGHFSLREQLQVKQRIINGLPHDWVVHQDVDEVLTGRNGVALREVIEQADAAGWSALNFDEFVFVPTEQIWTGDQSYELTMDRYYFFEPRPHRLQRAWRRRSASLSLDHGGHLLTGRRLAFDPTSHDLRHYISLSRERLATKYADRLFAEAEVDVGWHANRVPLQGRQLDLNVDDSRLLVADHGVLDRSTPQVTHFWEWESQ